MGQELDSVDRKQKLLNRLKKKVAARVESATLNEKSVDSLDNEIKHVSFFSINI